MQRPSDAAYNEKRHPLILPEAVLLETHVDTGPWSPLAAGRRRICIVVEPAECHNRGAC